MTIQLSSLVWERRQYGGHGIIHQNLTETLIRLTKSPESFSQDFPYMTEIQMFVVLCIVEPMGKQLGMQQGIIFF